MENKHTPGPWEFRFNYRPEKETIIHVAGEFWTVYSHGHDGKGSPLVLWAQCDDIQSEANARLIAAAPDLLEALKKSHETFMLLLDSINCGGVLPFTSNEFDATLDTIESAIAKAEGKS